MVAVYHPDTLEKALQVRAQTQAVPFSGGTDIMVRYRTRAGVLPDLPWPIVLLGHVQELQYIRKRKNSISVGAETTLTDVMNHPLTPEPLRTAVSQMAAPALRNLGTLAGNIGNASPAGDAICALIALDAELVLSSLSGMRLVSVEQFILGPGKTVLRDDEIITEITLALEDGRTSWYRKVGTRRANALSKLSVAGDWSVTDNRVDSIRIALGAVAPVVLRIRTIEDMIAGMTREEVSKAADELAAHYGEYIRPIDDQRSTSAYRKGAACNLVKELLGELGGGSHRYV